MGRTISAQRVCKSYATTLTAMVSVIFLAGIAEQQTLVQRHKHDVTMMHFKKQLYEEIGQLSFVAITFCPISTLCNAR